MPQKRATTQMRYAVFMGGRCIESLCYSLRSARCLKKALAAACPQLANTIEIHRYDRSTWSKYDERVE